MTHHAVGTREEWLVARRALLEAEKDLTRRSDEVARQRQELPWVQVDKDYRFDTEIGDVSLRDLFRGRSQLIVHHFMFPPSWAEGCPSCSAVADGYDGFRVHLENHDVAMTTVSRARSTSSSPTGRAWVGVFHGCRRSAATSTSTSQAVSKYPKSGRCGRAAMP